MSTDRLTALISGLYDDCSKVEEICLVSTLDYATRDELNNHIENIISGMTEITRTVRNSNKLWSDIDLISYGWGSVQALVEKASRLGLCLVAELEATSLIAHLLIELRSLSDCVDDNQIALITQPDDLVVQEGLVSAIGDFSICGDHLLMDANSLKHEQIKCLSQELFFDVQERCQKELDALVTN